MVVFVPIILLFIGLGILFLCGKGTFLIAGYNTSSQAEKDKTNEKALCKAMAMLMFVLATCFLLIAIGTVYAKTLLWIGFSLFFVITIGFVIYANTGNRFKK